MKNFTLVAHRFAILFLAVLLVIVGADLGAQTVERERLVAAMTARVLSFVDIPVAPDREGPIRIGIFDDESLWAVLDELLKEEAYANRYEAIRIGSNATSEELEKLQAVLFSGENRRDISDTIRKAGQLPILFVGAFEGFLEEGGMLNFVSRQNRMTFEVHVGRARDRGISFRSKLLRLASRVVEK